MTQSDVPAVTIRPPTLDDVPAILALVHASDIAAVGEPDFTADEVREVLTAPNHDPRVDSWLALDPYGRALGWAFIGNPTGGDRDLVDVYVHPEYGLASQRTLFDLALARVPERAREFGHPRTTVRAGAIASETHWVHLIEAAGFQFIKRYARMARDLTAADTLPQPPAGVTVRTLRHDDDVEVRAFYEVLRAAFADIPDSMTGGYGDYRATTAALPSVSWDEWFVAEVDGAIVGALQSADQGIDLNEGWVKHLGVAKEHRGAGLGRLLLRTAFATYAAKGRASAGLGVDLTNPTGAYPLYESVGMRPVYEADVFERIIEAHQ